MMFSFEFMICRSATFIHTALLFLFFLLANKMQILRLLSEGSSWLMYKMHPSQPEFKPLWLIECLITEMGALNWQSLSFLCLNTVQSIKVHKQPYWWAGAETARGRVCQIIHNIKASAQLWCSLWRFLERFSWIKAVEIYCEFML